MYPTLRTRRKNRLDMNLKHSDEKVAKRLPVSITTMLKAEDELRALLMEYGDEHCTTRYLDRIHNAAPDNYSKSIIGILYELKMLLDSPMVLENVIQAAQEIPIVSPEELREYIDEWSMGGEYPNQSNGEPIGDLF